MKAGLDTYAWHDYDDSRIYPSISSRSNEINCITALCSGKLPPSSFGNLGLRNDKSIKLSFHSKLNYVFVCLLMDWMLMIIMFYP